MITLDNGKVEIEVGMGEQGHNGKWSSTFENFRVHGDTATPMSTITSAALWDSQQAARDAGQRALAVLDETGKYPNLCEIW